jgi:hypothetical protein
MRWLNHLIRENTMATRTHLFAVVSVLVVVLAAGAIIPASADFTTEQRFYAAKCKAASFARRGPGTLSTAMRNAEIQRCIKNKGFLD